MNTFLIIAFAIFGLLIGSFINVLILRYNTGKGFGGRSQCFSCARQLTTRDLLPVFSFLFSGGRCRTCKSKISKQYILVELVTAILFVLVYLHNRYLLGDLVTGMTPSLDGALLSGTALSAFPMMFIFKSLIDCTLMALLVFMAGYDIRHKIIPDMMVFVFGGLALFGSIVSQVVYSQFDWKLLLAGPLLALPFYLIWLFSGGRWMGLGDAKLALGFGWMLGLSLGGTAVIFGFWVGAAYAIVVMILRPDILLRKKILFISLIGLVMWIESAYGAFQISSLAIRIVLALLIIGVIISQTSFLKKMTRFGYLPALQMKSEVPFAPFLITGLLIVYVLGYNLFTFGM